jgi:hypothetical protein
MRSGRSSSMKSRDTLVCELHDHEPAEPRHGLGQGEEVGIELRRHTLVADVHDGVIERDGHAHRLRDARRARAKPGAGGAPRRLITWICTAVAVGTCAAIPFKPETVVLTVVAFAFAAGMHV